MKIAVIKTGGKQYIVKEGALLTIEKLESEVGQSVIFDQVLFVADEAGVQIGRPILSGAKVTAQVTEQSAADKVVGVKFKAKKRVFKKFGHRQKETKIKIEKIEAGK